MNRAMTGKSITLLAVLALLAGCAATVGTDDPAAQSSGADLVVSNPAPAPGDPTPDPDPNAKGVSSNPADRVKPGDDNGEPRPNPWTGDVPGDDNGEPRPNPWNPHSADPSSAAQTTTK